MVTFVCVVNKGGAGKTTTSIAMLDRLSKMGYKCLGVDLDAQGNLTHTSGVSMFNSTSSDLFTNKSIRPIYKSRGFDVVPANNSLQDLEKKIFSKYNAHSLLKHGLKPYRNEYDVCVIDCSSHIDMIAQNALVAADIVICPILAEGWSFDGFSNIESEIENLRNSGLNDKIEIGAIVIHKYHMNYIIHKAIFADFKRRNYSLFTVKDRIAISESQYECRSIFDYDPSNDAAIELGIFIDRMAHKYLKPITTE